MSKIKILDKEVISQIAAGEVIERPASVVRELIDNSIDAKASKIVCKAYGGGMKELQVIDNGSGMSREDIKVCYKKHATSKISDIKDIFKISSLGFRGEALAAISTVSNTIISSSDNDSGVGYMVEIHGGKLIKEGEVYHKKGTSVVVKGLFYNTPARFSFLKSQNYEASLIKTEIIKKAIPFTKIAFDYYLNDKLNMQVKSKSIRERILEIFNIDELKNLIEVNFSDPFVEIKGYISPHDITFPTRIYEYFFVNNRNVFFRSLNYSIMSAYEDLIPSKRYPAYFLLLYTDPSRFDINIHPAKREIRFKDERYIGSAIREAIRRALKKVFSSGGYTYPDSTQGRSISINVRENTANIQSGNLFSATGNNTLIKEETYTKEYYKIIGQIFSTYIIIELEGRIAIIDQHAAAERINYERLLAMYRARNISSQTLITPMIIGIESHIGDSIARDDKLFKDVGFDIDYIGNGAFQIHAIPSLPFIDKINIKDTFIEVAHSIYEQRDRDEIGKDILKDIACKMSIKAGDDISNMEIKKLIDEVLYTQIPKTCPHGRPYIKYIEKSEIERMFLR